MDTQSASLRDAIDTTTLLGRLQRADMDEEAGRPEWRSQWLGVVTIHHVAAGKTSLTGSRPHVYRVCVDGRPVARMTFNSHTASVERAEDAYWETLKCLPDVGRVSVGDRLVGVSLPCGRKLRKPPYYGAPVGPLPDDGAELVDLYLAPVKRGPAAGDDPAEANGEPT